MTGSTCGGHLGQFLTMLASARARLQIVLSNPAVAWFFIAVLVGGVVGTVAFGLWAWTWTDPLLHFGDALTAVAVTFTVGTFGLAAVAGFIAFAAYLVATQTPDLEVTLQFPFAEGNRLRFMVDPTDRRSDGYNFLANFRQLQGDVVIRNRSPFSAHNPACRLELEGLAGVRDPVWSPVAWNAMGDATVIQWDGGADYIVHGDWSRTIHIDLRSVIDLNAGNHGLIVTLVADGFRRTFPFEVEVLTPQQWLVHHRAEERNLPGRITAYLGDRR